VTRHVLWLSRTRVHGCSGFFIVVLNRSAVTRADAHAFAVSTILSLAPRGLSSRRVSTLSKTQTEESNVVISVMKRDQVLLVKMIKDRVLYMKMWMHLQMFYSS
jgi:hypothetical protein